MAGKLVCLSLLGCFVAVCTGMTTHATRPPPEYDQFLFVYDPTIHSLGLSERYKGVRSCFILALSATEQAMVHSRDGMTQLQLKMLTHLNTATRTAMTLDDLSAQSKKLGHICAHATNVYTMSI